MAVETIIAVSIITISILSIMSVAQKSISLSYQSLHTVQASFLLEEGAEAVRIVRDNSWDNISALNINTDYYFLFTDDTWTLSSTPNTLDRFTRKVKIFNVNRDNTTQDIVSTGGTNDSGTKLFIVTVSWSEGGTIVSKSLSFYLTDLLS